MMVYLRDILLMLKAELYACIYNTIIRKYEKENEKWIKYWFYSKKVPFIYKTSL